MSITCMRCTSYLDLMPKSEKDLQASLRGRIGGLALAAQRNPKEYTAAARRQFLARFDDEVDPDRILSKEERARRAEAARKLYFVRLAYESAKARGKKNRKKLKGSNRNDE